MKPQTKKKAEQRVAGIYYELMNLPRLSMRRRKLNRQLKELDKDWELGLFKYKES